MKGKAVLFFLLAIVAGIVGAVTLRWTMGLVVATGLVLVGIRYLQDVPTPRMQGLAIFGWTLVAMGALLGIVSPI